MTDTDGGNIVAIVFLIIGLIAVFSYAMWRKEKKVIKTAVGPPNTKRRSKLKAAFVIGLTVMAIAVIFGDKSPPITTERNYRTSAQQAPQNGTGGESVLHRIMKNLNGDNAERSNQNAVQQAAAGPSAAQLAWNAVSKVMVQPKWDRIEITEAKDNDYLLTLVYRSPPSDLFEVEVDTTAIARAMLSELVASGYHPSRDFTSVFVWAQRPVRGETGEALVATYGYTVYDYGRDSLEFTPH
jgi:Na+-transporting methylmalonyl-CoA/oxaloacetate decarboxylase gamma subunit